MTEGRWAKRKVVRNQISKGGIGQIIQSFVGKYNDFEFYYKCNEKPLMTFKQVCVWGGGGNII